MKQTIRLTPAQAIAIRTGDLSPLAGLDPLVLVALKKRMAQLQRQAARVEKREAKYAAFKINSPRECARRVRQIARGSLTVANGAAA